MAPPVVPGRVVTADRVTVAAVPAFRVLALRHAVLRPGRPESEARYSVDDAPTTVHVAVVDDEDTVISCGTFFPEPLDGEPAWRIRGMATDQAHRGRGLGSAVLRAGVQHVADAGGTLVWCNARSAALSLYRRAGFEIVGDEFDTPVGPHYRAVLRIPTTAGQANETVS